MSFTSERQWLGVIEPIDVGSHLPVDGELSLRTTGLHFRRTRGGVYGVESDGLFDEFLPSLSDDPRRAPMPPSIERTVRVEDPSGRYLRRSFVLELPRSQSLNAPNSIYRAVRVPLFPAPRRQVPSGWTAIRVSLRRASDDAPLGGALVRALRGSEEVGRGMSSMPIKGDSASLRTVGEALLLLPALQHVQWDDGDEGPVLLGDLELRLEVTFSPDAPPEGFYPDPSTLSDEAPSEFTPTDPVTIRAGQQLALSKPLLVTVP